MAPVAIDVQEQQITENGKILERSQEDGEFYSKPTIGIIYPPPEVRNIVDRTALFVARNGPEFEDRIRANEAENTKFNFLNPNDPYYAYYEYKLKDFRENDTQEPDPEPEKEISKVGEKTQIKLKQSALLIETIIPKDPPPVYEYTADPPTISAIDLDIVKLTAQFVAKNGKGFLTNLMTREQRNYQFDFLRPQHSLFQYFTRLVEQYTKILLPPADVTKKLHDDVADPWKILDRVRYRVEWQRHQEKEKRKVEDEKERARIAFAQIDWHDFVVVETVNFREGEAANLPPPVTRDQLGSRILAQERFENMKKSGEVNAEQIEMDVDEEEETVAQPQEELYQPEEAQEKMDDEKADSDMEEESDEEDDNDKQKPRPPMMPPPAVPPAPGVNAQIRKDYDPKAQKQAAPAAPPSDKYLISPLTGEKVPVDSMAAHMKISLLDPRWKEQKEKSIEDKRHQEQVFAEGVHIGDTLKQLAERRSDIFGVGVEETLIGRKLGEEEQPKKQNKEIWDGHTASMERATKLAHSNITFEDQIKAIHKSKGLLPSDDAEKIGPSAPGSSSSRSKSKSKNVVVEPPTVDLYAPSSKHKQPKAIIVNPQSGKKPPPLMGSVSPVPPPMPTPPNVMIPPPGRGPPPMPPPHMNRGPMPPMGPPPPLMPPNMPPPMMMPPRMPNMPPPQPPMMPRQPMQQPQDDQGIILPPPMDDDEPVSKKAKVDMMEADLIPEPHFLRQNRLPVTFRIQVPEIPDKADWQCQGQVLKICLPLPDSCSVIKAKIYEMIGMPVGKQKLQLGNLFLKDSNTLAYYNFTSASLVHLQVKERGGRKK